VVPSAQEKPPGQQRTRPAQEEPVITYPPAWKNSADLISYPPAPTEAAAEPVDRGSASIAAFGKQDAQKKFVVRCEGRWRVRSAPSLSSKVIGTIANGTVVAATEEHGELQGGPSRNSPAEAESGTITCLWVRVVQFDAQEPMGVSEIKRDAASGGALYCLRRNALGYGLYEVGVEPLDGPLITLPTGLSSELRTDAQRASADKSEDISLTWKLLSAAEHVGRFFSAMSTGTNEVDAGGINEDMKPHVRRRPDDVFEAWQKEQLRKSAGSLKRATQKLIAKVQPDQDDVTTGLPKEVSRPFARLRQALAEASRTAPVAVNHQLPAQAATAASASIATSSVPSAAAAHANPAEGSVADLERFAELLGRVERTGGWPELSIAIRTDVINFSTKHTRDLEEHARTMGKVAVLVKDRPVSNDTNTPVGSITGAIVPAEESLIGDLDLIASPVAAPSPPTNSFKCVGLPLLPPPPPPAKGVSMGQLI